MMKRNFKTFNNYFTTIKTTYRFSLLDLPQLEGFYTI